MITPKRYQFRNFDTGDTFYWNVSCHWIFKILAVVPNKRFAEISYFFHEYNFFKILNKKISVESQYGPEGDIVRTNLRIPVL